MVTAWTNARKDTSGNRAEWWLKKLREAYEIECDDRLCPRVQTYNAVIFAWVRADEPARAENVLMELMRHEKKDKIQSLAPNTESFAMVIRAWLKSGDEHFAEERCKRAAKWLDELIAQEQAGHDGVTSAPELFDGVLKAASKIAYRRPDILEFAIITFEKYQASPHRVSFMAYVWLLRAGLLALGTPEFDRARNEFIYQLVHDCCEDGLLSNLFVRGLASGPVYYDGWTRGESARLTKELFTELEWPLPLEWSRNLPQDHFRPQPKDTKRASTEIKFRDQNRTNHRA